MDMASQIAMMESIFISAAIDAKEEQDVAIMDLPGVFLHAENDDRVVMFMKRKMAEHMAHFVPQIYNKYTTTSKWGEKFLYMRVQKALCGMLKCALLFYWKLWDDLEWEGFKVNPYDLHVANKQINGDQMTVVWHVDDLKISHKDPWEVTKMAIFVSKIYGDVKVQCWKKLDYLEMHLDYTTPSEVKISMVPYMQNIMKGFPEEIMSTANTPVVKYLFEVWEDTKSIKLLETPAIDFHHNVTKLLFICNGAKQYIQTPVAFLTTRVQEPDEDDWGKLKLVIKYLNGTHKLGLILKADDMGIIKWYVDESCAIHHDCQGHTGVWMMFGRGAVTSFSQKQKINTEFYRSRTDRG